MPQHPRTSPTYTDSSPFVRLLSTPGRVKILDVLLRRHSSKLTAGEIAEQAGIDPGTFSRNKDLFLELDIVTTTQDGRQTMYQLNTDSEVVKHFGRAHTELLSHAEAVLGELGLEYPDHIERLQEFMEENTGNGDDDDHENSVDVVGRNLMKV